MRKLVPRTLVFALACAVLGPWGCGNGSEQSSPAIEQPFRPPTGSTYLLAGQDSEQLRAMPRAGFADGYLDRGPVRPSGISLYGGFPEPNAREGFGSLAWVQTANDYIADRMRARDVQGVAFVWTSANLTFNPDGPDTIMLDEVGAEDV